MFLLDKIYQLRFVLLDYHDIVLIDFVCWLLFHHYSLIVIDEEDFYQFD